MLFAALPSCSQRDRRAFLGGQVVAEKIGSLQPRDFGGSDGCSALGGDYSKTFVTFPSIASTVPTKPTTKANALNRLMRCTNHVI